MLACARDAALLSYLPDGSTIRYSRARSPQGAQSFCGLREERGPRPCCSSHRIVSREAAVSGRPWHRRNASVCVAALSERAANDRRPKAQPACMRSPRGTHYTPHDASPRHGTGPTLLFRVVPASKRFFPETPMNKLSMVATYVVAGGLLALLGWTPACGGSHDGEFASDDGGANSSSSSASSGAATAERQQRQLSQPRQRLEQRLRQHDAVPVGADLQRVLPRWGDDDRARCHRKRGRSSSCCSISRRASSRTPSRRPRREFRSDPRVAVGPELATGLGRPVDGRGDTAAVRPIPCVQGRAHLHRIARDCGERREIKSALLRCERPGFCLAPSLDPLRCS